MTSCRTVRTLSFVALLAFTLPLSATETAPGDPTVERLRSFAAAHADGVPLDEAATDADRKRLADGVAAFYTDRSEPAWFDGDAPRAAARELVRALEDSRDEGLVPEAYDVAELARLLDEAETFSDDQRLDLDLRLTRTFLVFASHLASGRVDPTEIDPAWQIVPPRSPLVPVLAEAVESGRVRRALDTLRPPQAQYDQLTRSLAQYRKLAAAGGWVPVPDGDVLEVGDEMAADRLDTLVARLQATGELSRGYRSSGVYDETLAQAVSTFQERRGLLVDGKVGPNTLEALNVPVDEAIEAIVLNLERWRWLPHDLGPRHLHVNLAAFELAGFDGERQTLAMRVVVGKEGHATPVFQDVMEYVVVNPYWNIPTSLAVREILPEVQKDPGYVARKGYEVLSGWGDDAPRLDPYQVPWRSYSASNFPVRLRQPPGPNNALGLVKFIFPNEGNIYLHDSPAEHLFDRPERDFSHGCVRVEDPYKLADWVFEPSGKLTEGDVRTKVALGEREHVLLDEHLPVYLLYWTAFVDGDGNVQMRDDIYGHDRRLATALEGRMPRGLKLGA
jgi:murein L,D-transpeptidase YcbB/YkuD